MATQTIWVSVPVVNNGIVTSQWIEVPVETGCTPSESAPSAPATVGMGSQPLTLFTLIASANVEQALSSVSLFFQKAVIWAVKAFTDVVIGSVEYLDEPHVNEANIRVGADDGVVDPVYIPDVLRPGDKMVIEAPVGQKYDLSKFKMIGPVAGDGVFITFS